MQLELINLEGEYLDKVLEFGLWDMLHFGGRGGLEGITLDTFLTENMSFFFN